MDEALTVYLSIFGEKNYLQSLAELVVKPPYSQEYLSIMARRGLLDAVWRAGYGVPQSGRLRIASGNPEAKSRERAAEISDWREDANYKYA